MHQNVAFPRINFQNVLGWAQPVSDVTTVGYVQYFVLLETFVQKLTKRMQVCMAHFT